LRPACPPDCAGCTGGYWSSERKGGGSQLAVLFVVHGNTAVVSVHATSLGIKNTLIAWVNTDSHFHNAKSRQPASYLNATMHRTTKP
jgi:hypothetical protein